MSLTRRRLIAAFAAVMIAVQPLAPLAQSALAPSGPPVSVRLAALVGQDPVGFVEAIRHFEQHGDISFAPHMIFAMRFSGAPSNLFDALLQKWTGEARAGWFEWMLWQEAHPEIVPHESYADFKRTLYLSVDPNFSVFLDPEYLSPERAKIRFEEVAWGGVRKDGIPSLDNPSHVPAADADYLRDDDLVFGVAINGDARAYPLRIMGWHEMFNEVIGGVPVALAYCTLCGSGILFETAVDGSDPFVFGSSGFLYRSNKLMFDRTTHTLWNQFTGKPVIGPLADSGIALKQRPVVITKWGDWRTQNPDTTVLSLDTGHRRDYGSGVVYRDYFASPDLMFPASADTTLLAKKDYVFGIRQVGTAKAWPLEAFAADPVINDRVGALSVVLVGDAEGRTVRAYERGPRTFTDGLVADGAPWQLTEDALIGPNGTRLPRVPGHIAYWFAWDGYLGATSELYSGN